MAKKSRQNKLFQRNETQNIYDFITNIDLEIRNIDYDRLEMSEDGLVYQFRYIFNNSQIKDVLSGQDIKNFKSHFENDIQANDDSLSEFEAVLGNQASSHPDQSPELSSSRIIILDSDVFVREQSLEQIVSTFLIGEIATKKTSVLKSSLFQWSNQIPLMRGKYGISVKDEIDGMIANLSQTYSCFLNLRDILSYMRQELLRTLQILECDSSLASSTIPAQIFPESETAGVPTTNVSDELDNPIELPSMNRSTRQVLLPLPKFPTPDNIEQYLHYLFDRVDNIGVQVRELHSVLQYRQSTMPSTSTSISLPNCNIDKSNRPSNRFGFQNSCHQTSTSVPTLAGLFPLLEDTFHLKSSDLLPRKLIRNQCRFSNSSSSSSSSKVINSDPFSSIPTKSCSGDSALVTSSYINHSSVITTKNLPTISDEAITDTYSNQPSSDSEKCDYSITSIEVGVDEADALRTNPCISRSSKNKLHPQIIGRHFNSHSESHRKIIPCSSIQATSLTNTKPSDKPKRRRVRKRVFASFESTEGPDHVLNVFLGRTVESVGFASLGVQQVAETKRKDNKITNDSMS